MKDITAATGRTQDDILYVQTPDEGFGTWVVNFKVQVIDNQCKGINHRFSGYGKEELKEYIQEGTPVIVTGNISIKWIMQNTNVDQSGPSDWDINLTNEQYIAGMLANGCYMTQL